MTEIHVQPGMAYSCHNEGVCCHVFNTISVDSTVSHTLDVVDHDLLNATAHNPVGSDITEANPAEAGAEKLTRKACGSCSMLTPDNLCAIHALAGLEAKPQACQDFPYRYVNTPGGIYVGLSFVCPSVRGNKGTPLVDQLEQMSVHYPRAASVRNAPGVVPLNARINLRWTEYLDLEAALLEILSFEGEPLSNRLIGVCLLPGFIDQMMAGAGGNEVSFRDILSAIRANDYRHLLRLARKETGANLRSRRMFLGMYTSFANTLHRRQDQGRFVTVCGVMGQYMRHALGLGKIRLEPVTAELSRGDLDGARLPESGPAAEAITRYLAHCLFRKDVTLTGDLTRRIRLLALNGALVGWYAEALACADCDGDGDGDENGEGRSGEPRFEHWDEAIGHVERLYGFHSTFHQFFETNRVFADIVDSYILKPGYPFTLFR